MKTALGSYRGTPTRAVVEDNFSQWIYYFALASQIVMRKYFYHTLNTTIQSGMMDRFAARNSADNSYDSKSHSYSFYMEGWYAMDEALKQPK
jgi:hypothetical protein